MGPFPTGKPDRYPEPCPPSDTRTEHAGEGLLMSTRSHTLPALNIDLQQAEGGVEGVSAQEIGGAFTGGVDHGGVEVELGEA